MILKNMYTFIVLNTAYCDRTFSKAFVIQSVVEFLVAFLIAVAISRFVTIVTTNLQIATLMEVDSCRRNFRKGK